ncbi:hypothetical protein [Bosea sp. (in: a-proteobacteria)]|jgi:hypothetical protein|uniref:hypothetical protein n=1 Tax=Bosea sp. (in: a-proteobacteria) TaxID=1871050 RepID=UPI00356A5B61
MNHSFSSAGGTVLGINMQFLSATLCGGIAWWAWPSSAEWWQLGFLSVILWVGCATSLIKGVRLMLRLWTRTRTIRAFEAQGKAPKSSTMAPISKLEQMGMLDE